MTKSQEKALEALERIESFIDDCEVMCVEIRDDIRLVDKHIRTALSPKEAVTCKHNFKIQMDCLFDEGLRKGKPTCMDCGHVEEADQGEALEKAIDALTGAASIIDVVKQEWEAEKSWTEYDQGVRENITSALLALYPLTSYPQPERTE